MTPTLRHALCALILTLALVSGGVVSAAPEGVPGLFAKARAARQAGNLRQALGYLLEAYRRQPAPSLLNNLGKLYEELGWYDKAVDAYQRVVDDVKAPLTLRSLDAARVAVLKPKLGKAWLALNGASPGTWLWIDGRAVRSWEGREVGVSPGRRHIELRAPGGTVTWLRILTLPTDRRTRVSAALDGRAKATAAVIQLSGDTANLVGIRVAGFKLGPPVTALRTIYLTAGRETLVGSYGKAGDASWTLDLSPGKTTPLTLRAPAAKPKPLLRVPVKTATRSPLASILLLSLGTVSAAIGVGMMVAGSQKVSALNDAMASESPVTSFSLSEAQSLRDEANTSANIGVAALSLGGAAIVTGLILFLTRPSSAPDVATQRRAAFALYPGLGSLHLKMGF